MKSVSNSATTSARADKDRREAAKTLRALSPGQLRVARDFLAYLRSTEDEATREILSNARMTGDVRASRNELRARGSSAFTAWEAVRSDV